MLPKHTRLSRREFTALFKRGNRRSSPHFSAIVGNIGETQAFSAVTSKKVSPKAVVRNKVRRKIYGVLMHISKTNPSVPPAIIFAKKGTETLVFHDMLSELTGLLK